MTGLLNLKLSLLLFFLWSAPLLALPPQSWLSELDKALQLARKKKQPLLLDIYTPWCRYCRKLQKEIYPSRSVRGLSQKFIRVRINGENREKKKNIKTQLFMERYGGRGYPTIVLLDSNGLHLDTIHGFITASPLRSRLKRAYQKAAQRQKVLAKLKEEPHSITSNYKAGTYHFTAEAYAKARKHFLRAWKNWKNEDTSKVPKISKVSESKSRSNLGSKAKQALYNAAVCSMHMDNYANAVYEWNLYLQHYPRKNKEYIYARYYRGLSYFYQGKRKASRADLSYANKYLGGSEEGHNAKILLQNIP